MTPTLSKLIANLITIPPLITMAVSPALAGSPTERILEIQRDQIQELNLQLQVQRNQEQIERMQDQIVRGNRRQPEVVVIQQERRGPSIPGVILGAALSNGYLSCGGNRSCDFGYGSSGRRWGGSGWRW